MFRWLFGLIWASRRAQRLVEQSADPEPEVRRRAAAELGRIGQGWAAERLLPLLADTHSIVREASRQALRLQGAAALPTLLQGLNAPQDEVASAAAELLGELRDERAVGPLLEALKYARRPVQLAAGRALGQCGAVAVPMLRAALSETQPWVRRQVERALATAEAGGENVERVDPK
jgi:HEAT repeat protein